MLSTDRVSTDLVSTDRGNPDRVSSDHVNALRGTEVRFLAVKLQPKKGEKGTGPALGANGVRVWTRASDESTQVSTALPLRATVCPGSFPAPVRGAPRALEIQG